MRTFLATPVGTPRGGIVVIQEAFGLNAHIEDVSRRFAGAGYLAVAPELFHRSDDPGPFSYDDFAAVIPAMAALSDDLVLADIDAVIAHLATLGITPDRTGIVGFCMGGRVSFLVAARRALGAAVGFYGGGIVTARFPQLPALVDEVPALATPWLGLFGDRDGSIPVDDVEQLREALADAPVATDVVRYAAAEHGFFCDLRPSYDPDAAADAWSRTIAWFERLDAR
ncbi:MAG: dienelactone hydrolase family protein [Acidimicrobiia bacterium]